MTRTEAIIYIRVAGYHGDQTRFIRLYTENRISYQAAQEAYKQGQQQKAAGMTCRCHKCKLTTIGLAKQ